MKTALGGGSQHREKAVNDSGGGGINNAGLPLSLQPSVPRSLSPSFLPPTLSPPLYVPPPVVACKPPLLLLAPASQASGLSSRGSSYQPASAASFLCEFPCCQGGSEAEVGGGGGEMETFVRPLPASTFSHLWPPAPRPLGSSSVSPQPWAEATSGRRKR